MATIWDKAWKAAEVWWDGRKYFYFRAARAGRAISHQLIYATGWRNGYLAGRRAGRKK
jgi:hypothetical protein